MHPLPDLGAGLPADFDLDAVQWTRIPGGPPFDYPIDYAYAPVCGDPATGRIDLLFRWAPNAYCHYHRHLGSQVAHVLQGEQHIYEQRPFETVHKVRQPGFRALLPDGETHMEHGGPQGLTMLFSIHAPDGRLYDMLDAQGNVLLTVTLEDALHRRLGVAA